MTIAEQLHARQAELRNRMAMGIAKGFETDIQKAEDSDLEKAHQDGDMHPNGKWVWVSSANGGKGDWRTAGGRAHQKHAAAHGGSATKPSGVKTWDKGDSFNQKGSDENKLWNYWYKFQTSGDPMRMGQFVDVLQKKFPNVAEWNQTAPNTGKAIVTAKDSAGKEVASIDLSGDTIDLTKLQTFMDKCYNVKAVAQAKSTTGNGDTAPKVTDQVLRSTLKELALTGTIRNLKGVSQQRRGEILDELEKRGFIDSHMQATQKGTKWLTDTIGGKASTPTTKKYSEMDIKDAKKALVGKVITFKDYGSDGLGHSADMVGEIKNVRKYGKNQIPIAEVEYPSGDTEQVRLSDIDDGKLSNSYKTPVAIGDDRTKLDAIKKKIADAKRKLSVNGLKYNYDDETNETWYEGAMNGKRVRVLQETVGSDDWWNLEVNGKVVKTDNGKAMAFQTAQEAADEGKIQSSGFSMESLTKKADEAAKKAISVNSGSSYSMTNAMREMFNRMGLKNKVEVSEGGGFNLEYKFKVDGTTVQGYKVYSRDGNMGYGNFFSCVNDCIAHAIIKNEKLTGADKQKVEDMFDTFSRTAPNWKKA